MIWQNGPVTPETMLRLLDYGDSVSADITFSWSGLALAAAWLQCALPGHATDSHYCVTTLESQMATACASALELAGVWRIQRSAQPQTVIEDGKYLSIQRRVGSRAETFRFANPERATGPDARRAARVFAALEHCLDISRPRPN